MLELARAVVDPHGGLRVGWKDLGPEQTAKLDSLGGWLASAAVVLRQEVPFPLAYPRTENLDSSLSVEVPSLAVDRNQLAPTRRRKRR